MWINRAEQLLSKMPDPSDGEHAAWLDPANNPKGAEQGKHFNNIDAVIRHHKGEIKVLDTGPVDPLPGIETNYQRGLPC